MIKLNNKRVNLNYFPDGTLLMRELAPDAWEATITWLYENNEELVALYFLTRHLQSKGIRYIYLKLPYIPNARQDRVKAPEDVFTLKYFAQMINFLGFSKVTVLDPHSHVSEDLINNLEVQTPKKYVEKVLEEISQRSDSGGPGRDVKRKKILLFYPDQGAMKRYSAMFREPYVFGVKKPNRTNGEIEDLEVAGQTELIRGSTILMIDDICSKGDNFYYHAKALKKAGADQIYLYVSHCENTILEGEILKAKLIEQVYTTNSIFRGSHNKVEVFLYE